MQQFFRDPRQRALVVVTALVVLAVCSLGLSGMTGSVALSLPELDGALRELVHGGATTMAATLLELRCRAHWSPSSPAPRCRWPA
jgi:hypothetical protein